MMTTQTQTPTTDRKRFQDNLNPFIPTLVLDEDGSIEHLTDAARNLLEHKDTEHIDPCFFAHVHGRNMHQVMRDMAEMVRYDKSKAKWLLRLRTGKGRWRWYQAQAKKTRNGEEPHITVKLHDLHDW